VRRTVVLVTGATGFTGGHLARALAARGYDVRALVRRPKESDTSDTSDTSNTSGITIVPGDLRDTRALADATAGVDVVYHIAAVYRQAGLPTET